MERDIDFIAVVADEVAWRWIQPLAEAGPLGCLAADAIEDTLRSSLSALNVKDAQTPRALATALGCQPSLPFDKAAWAMGGRFLSLDRSDYSLSESTLSLAQQCGATIASLLPSGVRTIVELLSDTNVSAAEAGKGLSGASAKPPGPQKTWMEMMAEEFKKADASTADIAKIAPVLAAAVPPVSKLRPEQLYKKLKDAFEALREELGKKVDWLREYLDEEHLKTVARAALADQIAQAGAPLDISSDTSLGRRVHDVLQRYYVANFPLHDIVTEEEEDAPYTYKSGYRPKIERLVVVGPIATQRYRKYLRLTEVAFSPLDTPFLFYTTLMGALQGFDIMKEGSQLRTDLVDVTERKIWEIKPVLSAESGVWAEYFYRTSFNLMQGAFLETRLKASVERLESGGFWPTELPSLAALGVDGVNVPTMFTATSSQSGTRLIVPFQLSVLPGLVLYLSPKSLNPNISEATLKLLKLLAALGVILGKKDGGGPDDPNSGTGQSAADALKKYLQRGKRRAEVTVEEVARALHELSQQVERVAREDPTGIRTNLLLGGIAVMLAAALGAAATKNPAFVGLLAMGVLAIVVSRSMTQDMPRMTPSIVPLIQATPPATAPTGADARPARRKSSPLGEFTTIKFGPVEFHNVPVKDAPVLVRQLTAACSRVLRRGGSPLVEGAEPGVG